MPDGRTLRTLKEAADHITALPEAVSDRAEWQVAIEALLLCKEDGHPVLARMAFLKAVNHGVVVPFDPDAKTHYWGQRKLKRDQ
jgi:hypothetical protein